MIPFCPPSLVLLAALAAGQDPEPPQKAKEPPAADGKSPFQVDPALADVLGRNAAQSAQGLEPQAAPLPEMRLRGLVQMAGQRPAALVEIVGVGTYTTREGEQLSFTLQGKASTPVVLRVQRIGRDGVLVEAGSSGRQLVMR